MNDRDIKSWDQRLTDQVDRKWENYLRRRIHLDDARALERISIAGEFLYVEEVSSASAGALIRFNRNTNDALDLDYGTVVKTVFTDIFINNDAQPDEWIDIVVGINFEYYKQQGLDILAAEAQACIILTNVGVGNVVAAANPCNRVLVRAHTANGGTVWIDFSQAGVVNACYELTAGDAISVPCNNTDRINGWFTVGGDIVTIVFEA